jgi:ATP-dependent Clp protease adaptor protein ClpS
MSVGFDTDGGAGTSVLPLPTVRPETSDQPRILPPYHVVLVDDDDHTYAYVIKMLQELFALELEEAYLMAVEVDTEGRAIVDTTTKERAEFKRDQIHAYGRDHLLDRSAGSMTAIIEPAE